MTTKVTIKQKEIIRLLSAGYTQKETAAKLNISIEALNDRLKRIKKKIKARTTYQVVAIFNQAA